MNKYLRNVIRTVGKCKSKIFWVKIYDPEFMTMNFESLKIYFNLYFP